MSRALLLGALAATLTFSPSCTQRDADPPEGTQPGGESAKSVTTSANPPTRAGAAVVGSGAPESASRSTPSAEPPEAPAPRNPAPSEPAKAKPGKAAPSKDGAPSGSGQPWAALTQGHPFVIGYEKGLREIDSSGKPGMFFIVTSWCAFSKKLARDSFTNPQVRKLLSRFVCVLVDAEAEPIASGQLGAQGYPHVVFRDARGRQLASFGGAQKPERVKAHLEKALRLAGNRR